jgi:hypothetical protein
MYKKSVCLSALVPDNLRLRLLCLSAMRRSIVRKKERKKKRNIRVLFVFLLIVLLQIRIRP